ncbi:uncharacterized protein N7482_001666 [Penicillium canariense]|uniref:SGNH hydrolase-type esterase domain-containing protein n=1 Tax=Penicillium canariense TaxID=189055 RepID=A0A9W9LU43_9EURO|nr:uncharacterized protein N7482_001666 [Penicillium canariense]KAJ5175789.1 hypothetical protein N7482_001666 [Penicillium canariense]
MPPFFVLAGDSTTATQSSDGGGWGDGFLNTTLFHGATGHNYGHNGATTVSFRAGGDWNKVLSTVKNVSQAYHPFVTIQFGHNDQKAAANISLSQYTENLERFVTDAVDAGATPILVTPLSRRNYNTSTGQPRIIEDLANQANATITAAHNTGASFIDLNRESTRYLNAIGPTDAYTYNLIAADHTHLNIAGSIVFGGIVAELIQRQFHELKESGFVRVNGTLKKDVDHGVYYWP